MDIPYDSVGIPESGYCQWHKIHHLIDTRQEDLLTEDEALRVKNKKKGSDEELGHSIWKSLSSQTVFESCSWPSVLFSETLITTSTESVAEVSFVEIVELINGCNVVLSQAFCLHQVKR